MFNAVICNNDSISYWCDCIGRTKGNVQEVPASKGVVQIASDDAEPYFNGNEPETSVSIKSGKFTKSYYTTNLTKIPTWSGYFGYNAGGREQTLMFTCMAYLEQ